MRSALLTIVLLVSSQLMAQKKQITLEDIWQKGSFASRSVPGFNALKNGTQYTQKDFANGATQINLYDLASGKRLKTIFDNSLESLAYKGISIESYQFSKDEKKLLLFTAGQGIYRRSTLYQVYIYNIESKTISLLDTDKVLHASFSPDGTKVAFVKNNNLYYKDLTKNKTIAITQDGKTNEIINGNCDWVYEEEFEMSQAYQWSPQGNALAYYRFDERAVPEFTMMQYDSLYPTPYRYKYPKAGEPNSIIQIKIYQLASHKTTKADIGKETDLYIPRIKWTNKDDQLCIYKLNRHQNHLELLLTHASTGKTNTIYEETNNYYIDINDNLQFLPDGTSFIFNSEKSGYNHFYHYNWTTKTLSPLTQGNYDIESLIAIDEKNELLYYTSAATSPLERQLYVVNWKGENNKLLTPEKGTHAITPIAGYQFFLDKYSTLHTPPVYYLRDHNGKIVRILEDNKKLSEKLQAYDWGKIQFIKVDGAEAGTFLNGWMITPPQFDKTKKHPVLLFQYSGPGSQQVVDAFPARDYWWHQMLAQKGYIIVCVDGTGTGFRGEAFKKKTYLQLGNLESNDQIAVAKNLATLPYVDKDRIGIWGWSYGGFMSSTCIFKGADVFKAAIAVAPVTNWRYYDNIYTERYMRTPQENPKGYDDNAPEKMAKNLKGKYLVIHGTADDNVHFQNQVMLVNELIRNNKNYEAEYYPNRAHGISGGNARFHLYNRMTNFILMNL